MNTTTLKKLFCTALCTFALTACVDKYFEDPTLELYTRNFIKEFGLIGENQDWNMAQSAKVTVNVGDTNPKLVKIYCKENSKYYLVARLEGMTGSFEVPVDIPETCNEFMVNVDGGLYYGKLGQKIDCTGRPVSRASSYDSETGEFDYDPSDPSLDYTHDKNPKVGVQVRPLDYLYFNAQQMAPILSKEVWSDYWSVGDRAYKTNDDHTQGILPEIGTPNRTHGEGNSGHTGVTENFAYTTKDGSGEFDIYPMFYGSNLVHTLGVYLLGADGEPMRHDNGDIVKLPIYESKHNDDIQMKETSYASTKISAFALQDGDGNDIPKVNGNYRITLTKNGSKDLKIVFYNLYGDAFVPTDVSVSFDQADNNTLTEKSGSSYTYTITNNGATNDENDLKWGHIRLSANSEINKFSGNNNGSQGDLAFNVVVTEEVGSPSYVTPTGTNDIYYDSNTGKNSLNVAKDAVKTFNVVCKDGNGNTVSDYNGATLKVTNNNTSKYTASINGNTVTITGVTSAEESGTTYVYLDNNNNGSYDSGEPSYELLVNVNKAESTYSIVVAEASNNTINIDAGDTKTLTVHCYKNGDTSNDLFNISNIDIDNWNGPEGGGDAYFDLVKEGGSVVLKGYREGEQWPRIHWSIDGRDIIQTIHVIVGSGSGSGSTDEVSYITINGTTVSKNDNEPFNIELELGQDPVTYTVKCFDSDGNELDGNLSTNKVKITNWHTSYYNVSPNYSSSQFTITPIALGNDYEKIFYDPNNTDWGGSSIVVLGTLHVTVTSSSTRSKAKNRVSSRGGMSRAEAGSPAEWEELTGTGGILNKEGATWKNINKTYSPILDNADAYPTDKPLLLRSRGYHVKLMYNGEPWSGNFGMYIDWKWADGVGDLSVQEGRRELSGTHYSEQQRNDVTYNINGTDYHFQYSYAATFKHPKSENEYLCFEDWAISQPATDDVATDGTTTGVAYGAAFNWEVGNKGLYSSDRDLNDIIYRAVGLAPIPASELRPDVVEEGFTWIWALEDLGSFDDFDFNDVIIKINSLTVTTKVYDGDELKSTETVRQLTLTPLAAGGTMPLHIHLKYNNNDYVLTPGTYSSFDELPKFESDDNEYHRWFGVNKSSQMINTGNGTMRVPITDDMKCIFTLGSDFSLIKQTSDYNKIDGEEQYFYVTVAGMTTSQYGAENIDGSYTIPQPETGKATQSFLIYCGREDATHASNPLVSWAWPTERTHIIDAYPDFKNWVNHPDDDTYKKWMTRPSSDASLLYRAR